MDEFEKALQDNPLFRNRVFAATTISEAVLTAQRYGFIVDGLKIIESRGVMMPELAEAECLNIILRS